MRSLPCLLLLSCVSSASAGVFPITSFAPDTTAAPADTVSLPVWIGVQCSPVVGDSWVRGQPRTWDTEGMPWLAFSAAWPWTGPHEVWLGIGYERWRYDIRPEAIPFPSLLSLLNPVRLDQGTVRTGFDQLFGRGHVVSGALGGGLGLGLGYIHVGQLPGTEWSVFGEMLAHGLTYIRLDQNLRLGAGATGGLTFDLRNGGDPMWHWELEFRAERSTGRWGPAP